MTTSRAHPVVALSVGAVAASLLGEAGRRLKTIHGVGYRFFDAERASA